MNWICIDANFYILIIRLSSRKAFKRFVHIITMPNASERFEEIANKVEEHEFYTDMPEGYTKGKTKYIIVTGSVISGVGKGTFTSCLGSMLSLYYGLNIVPLKFECYMNYDSGTLNPFRHGEVFVLDDGTETDLDLGTYERMLNKNLTKDSFVT